MEVRMTSRATPVECDIIRVIAGDKNQKVQHRVVTAALVSGILSSIAPGNTLLLLLLLLLNEDEGDSVVWLEADVRSRAGAGDTVGGAAAGAAGG